MQIRSVGIDLGKTTFHLVALGDNGKVLLKKKFTQKQLIAFTANLPTCLPGWKPGRKLPSLAEGCAVTDGLGLLPNPWSTRGRIAIQAGPNRDGRLDDLV
jgi:hypothetical protein